MIEIWLYEMSNVARHYAETDLSEQWDRWMYPPTRLSLSLTPRPHTLLKQRRNWRRAQRNGRE